MTKVWLLLAFFITTLDAHAILRDISADVIRNGTTQNATLNVPPTFTTANTATIWDGTDTLASSTTTSAELAFVHGVTSSIQTQLNLLYSFTLGSVIFSNGTTLAQDNSKFFWNDSTFSLGIDTNTPAANLDVNGTVQVDNSTVFLNSTHLRAAGAGVTASSDPTIAGPGATCTLTQASDVTGQVNITSGSNVVTGDVLDNSTCVSNMSTTEGFAFGQELEDFPNCLLINGAQPRIGTTTSGLFCISNISSIFLWNPGDAVTDANNCTLIDMTAPQSATVTISSTCVSNIPNGLIQTYWFPGDPISDLNSCIPGGDTISVIGSNVSGACTGICGSNCIELVNPATCTSTPSSIPPETITDSSAPTNAQNTINTIGNNVSGDCTGLCGTNCVEMQAYASCTAVAETVTDINAPSQLDQVNAIGNNATGACAGICGPECIVLTQPAMCTQAADVITNYGLSLQAGDQCDITFATPYGTAPFCQLTPANVPPAAASDYYVTSTTTDFSINTTYQLNTNTSYLYNYFCIQPN